MSGTLFSLKNDIRDVGSTADFLTFFANFADFVDFVDLLFVLFVLILPIFQCRNIQRSITCVNIQNTLGKPCRKKSAVFLNIFQRGVKPVFKNYVVNLVCSGGHLTA